MRKYMLEVERDRNDMMAPNTCTFKSKCLVKERPTVINVPCNVVNKTRNANMNVQATLTFMC